MSNNKKGFIQEFKEFAMRGNVIDLAVGVIIGAGFQRIVTSLVNDIIMPIIGLITGGKNFNEQFLILRMPEGIEKSEITSISKAAELKVTTFNYGSFISSVIDFLIVALVSILRWTSWVNIMFLSPLLLVEPGGSLYSLL